MESIPHSMESIPHVMESIFKKYGVHPQVHGIHPPFHGFHLKFLESTPHSMDSIWIILGRVKYRLNCRTLRLSSFFNPGIFNFSRCMYLIDDFQSFKTNIIKGLKLLQILLNVFEGLHRVQNVTIAQWIAPSITVLLMPCAPQGLLLLLI